MSTSTANLGLVKPDGPDRALVAVINENMNKIDQAVGPLPSGKTIQGQIDETNSKLSRVVHTTPIVATTLADLKTNLLNAVNGVNSEDMLAVRIAPSFSSNGFVSGATYGGYAYNIYKPSGTSLYFSVILSNNIGEDMLIGYNNGEWYFNSLSSKIEPSEWHRVGATEWYYRKQLNIVEIQNRDYSGVTAPPASWTEVFTLPVGYRPSYDVPAFAIPGMGSRSYWKIKVNATGSVYYAYDDNGVILWGGTIMFMI